MLATIETVKDDGSAAVAAPAPASSIAPVACSSVSIFEFGASVWAHHSVSAGRSDPAQCSALEQRVKATSPPTTQRGFQESASADCANVSNLQHKRTHYWTYGIAGGTASEPTEATSVNLEEPWTG